MKQKLLTILVSLILPLTVTLSGFFVPTAHAQVSDYAQAQISLTFDDGFLSDYTNALPILQADNIKATAFITTGFLGTPDYMSWSQVQSLQNQYGWEIGDHTVDHPEMSKLNLKQIDNELTQSKSALEQHGLNVTSFATPFGDYNNTVLAESLKLFNLHRGFWDRDDLNSFPYNRAVIMVQSVEAGVTPAQVQAWITQAQTQHKWLVLVFHDVEPQLDPNYQYTITISDFQQMVNEIEQSGIKQVLMNSTLQKPGPNLVSNSTFDQGIASGWTTDNSRNVLVDKNNNGSYPSSQNAISMQGSTKAAHLFSPMIIANPKTTYDLETFVNSANLTKGELGFYIDEYDANGNWVSGQWIGAAKLKNVAYFTYLYTPSSMYVNSFKIQTYLNANSSGKAYLDNFAIYDLNPGVASTNLVANNSFEQTVNNFAANWTTDNTSFTLDTNSKGNDGTNSIHLTANNTDAHLISDKIAVAYGSTYLWKQYINTVTGSGEFGFYIDEYDANGNWISGQWKGAIYSPFTGFAQISYTPTSDQVASVDLQYYATAQSTFDLYLDSVMFEK